MQPRWIAVAGVIGVVSFVVAFLALSALTPPQSATREAASPAAPAVPTSATSADGRPRITAGRVAVSLPVSGLQVPIEEVRSGDRVDVIAALPQTAGRAQMSGIAVRGVVVLQPTIPGQSGQMLVEVTPEEAVVLTHLQNTSIRLNYALWSSGGAPAAVPPLDLVNARALLGLPALPSPTPNATQPKVEPTPQPTSTPLPPTPTPIAALATSQPTPETYVVQAGENLSSIASRLQVDLGALWWANREAMPDPNVVRADQELMVPRFRGGLYRTRTGDTLDSLSRRFGLSVDRLRQVNSLPSDGGLRAGVPLFIPDDSAASLIDAVLALRPQPTPQPAEASGPAAAQPAAPQATATPQPTPTLVPTPTPIPVAERISPGRAAVSLPIHSTNLPLLLAREGDRLDVLATLPGPPNSRPTPSVILEKAPVLLVATAADRTGGILVEVSPEEATVLADLQHRQIPLTYVLSSAVDPEPAEDPPSE